MKYIFYFCLFLSTFFLLACEKEKTQTTITQKPIQKQEKPLHVQIKEIEKDLSNIDTRSYLENYIYTVINEGLPGTLGYPSGAMEGGYAHRSDALDIARYVVTLSGKKSSDDSKAKKAAIFYTSNCGGCHGNDGKGLNGTFPNLSLELLQGIKKKKDELTTKMGTLKSKLNL